MSEMVLFWAFGLIMFATGFATGYQRSRDKVAELEERNMALRRMAYDYINAYEDLVFGDKKERDA